jgi:hypothetical protein
VVDQPGQRVEGQNTFAGLGFTVVKPEGDAEAL